MKTWLFGTALVGVLLLVALGVSSSGQDAAEGVVVTGQKKVVVLPDHVRVQREQDPSMPNSSGKEYRVTCKLVSDALSFGPPPIVVRDSERLTLSDTSEGVYVVGIKRDGENKVPITRKLEEGSVFEITVLGLEGDLVLIDIVAKMQDVTVTSEEQETQPLKMNMRSGRFIESVRLGEVATGEFGGRFGGKEKWRLEAKAELVGDK